MAVPFGPKQSSFLATTSAASATTTPGLATSSGNLLVVLITSFSNTIGASPITDNKGNTWVNAVGPVGTTSGFAAMYYAANCLGGAGHTATFTPNSADFTTITLLEITGAALTSVIGSTASGVTSTATHTIGSITSNASVPEIFLGVGSVSAAVIPGMATPNPGTWWVIEAQTGQTTEGCLVAFRLVASSVTDSFSYLSTARNEGAVMAGFKAAASGGGGAAGSAYTFFGA